MRLIIPIVDVLHRVSMRIVPIQSQGIITRDNVSVDVSAVAYFRIVDAVKSVVAIENLFVAIDQIAETTLRGRSRPSGRSAKIINAQGSRSRPLRVMRRTS